MQEGQVGTQAGTAGTAGAGVQAQVLLTPAQMAQADSLTIAQGTPGTVLMARAGAAVALAVARRWQPCRVAVLCGPGNNGGDGFVAAQWLRQRGWPVRLFVLEPLQTLRGDAAWAAQQWQGPCEPAQAFDPTQCDVVIDALFGAGLCRPLQGLAAQLVRALRVSGLPVCAVDVPSGLDGATGAPARAGQVQAEAQAAENRQELQDAQGLQDEASACVVQAALTVTFFRAKPGHWLLPGRQWCGELVLADIGIAPQVLARIEPAPAAWLNGPALWQSVWPRLAHADHKYHRGHVLVWGGALLTGAARLAAQAAQRVGAGLVTVAAPQPVWAVYAQSLQGCMVQALPQGQEAQAFAHLLAQARRNVCLIGPGAGVAEGTRQAVLAATQQGKHLVLDADALTVFAQQPQALCQALQASAGQAILTPHEGEFARLFGAGLDAGADKMTRARAAARQAQAVVVLKGADTVIAAPDGRCAINANAPASLATGGTGDVLAGLAAGLLAQGMPAFEAACAAAWLHGQVAQALGPALVAEDLLAPAALQMALQAVHACHGATENPILSIKLN